VRERVKVGSGVKQPKFRVVAVTYGARDEKRLRMNAIHFRKTEIQQIAKDIDAEIIYLEPMPENKRGKMKETT